jgi:hypothetical protein
MIELLTLRFLLKIREDICNFTLNRSVNGTGDEFCCLIVCKFIGDELIAGVDNAG